MTGRAALHFSRENSVPPTIVPPERPLGIPALIAALLTNPLRALSRDLYENPIVVYRGLGRPTAFVMAPELVREVFHDQSGSFAKNPLDRRIMARALGNGILIAGDDDWRWQRRVVAPLFTPAALTHTVPTIAAAARRLLEHWSASGPARVHDIGAAMVDLTFDIIHRTMLVDGIASDGAAIKRAIATYLAPITWEIAYDFLGLPEWMPHPGTWRMARAAKAARSEVAGLVAARRQSGRMGDDLLGRLIEARDERTGSPVSDGQIVDNLLTFLTAGHETTARVLTWSLYLAAFLPGWNDRLAKEIREVAGDDDISGEHVERLGLTRRFIHEAMRLFPSAPIISRVACRAVVLGGQRLAAGTRVLVPIYVIHRHRSIWREPDVFDPDRFADAAQIARPRYAFMPFGAGPRMCVGASFAMIEATVIMATLVRAARFETVGDPPPEPVTGITLTPDRPLLLKVTPA